MQSLLDGLREYWSLDEQRSEEAGPVDCNQIFSRAVDFLDTALKESGAEVTRQPLPTIRAEQYPVILLFQNLISYGIRYGRPGTKPEVQVSAVRDGAAWKFAVADNGIGIEAENLQTIFNPFRRLGGAEYAGPGLGLAMCQKIVERYHGRIWVESAPGKGSTFYFTLPAMEAAR